MDWRGMARVAASKDDPFEHFVTCLARSPASSVDSLKRKTLSVGRAWEEFCAQVLQMRGYDTVYMLRDAPPRLLHALGLKARDMGIDILAGHDGKWTAVQCKFRTRGGITWQQLSTFVALCACSGPYEEHLVMTNAPYVRYQRRCTKDQTMTAQAFKSMLRHQWLTLAGVDDAGRVCGGALSPRTARARWLDGLTTSRPSL